MRTSPVNISEGYTKAMKVFIKKAAQYGAKVVSDKGKHLKFRDGLGHQISAPKTTSDFRAIRNFESELRGRGFVRQETTKKVKDALVKGTKTTALPASRKTANQQTTFKDFTQKFQPNVQGPRRSELQVQADHILRTIEKKKRKKITRAQLDAMKISQKQRDALIKQGLVEDNKHRDAKLNYQYKEVTNPKRPEDPIKKIKKGLV